MLTLATDLPEVSLPEPPILRCLLQVRYSRTPEMLDAEVERLLARALPELPVRAELHQAAVVNGVSHQALLRTFESVDGDHRATFGADFLAYETTRYRGRTAFMEGVRAVLAALVTAPTPGRVERVGVRYTNAFTPIENIQRWLAPALLGVHDHLDPALDLRMQFNQSLIHVDEARGVQLVSGLVRSGETHDPSMPAREQDSWVLDIDSFDATRASGVGVDDLTSTVRSCAARAYDAFFWAARGFVDERGGEKA